MERLDPILDRLRAFAATRPVAYGAPVCAIVGALAGLALQTGPLDGPYTPEMEPARYAEAETVEPISWPAGKIPDYVVGTDFARQAQAPPIQMASYEPTYEPPPMPEIPAYVAGEHGPATPPPNPDAPHWASARGDITDVSLPEDRATQPAPTVLADAAATGMTTR